jgi:hypothetical protein
LGYLVYVGEVVAPLLILVGLFTRAAALVVVINMIVALLLVHTSQFFTLNNTGGWALELQGLYLGAAVAVALLGAGRYRIGGAAGRFNWKQHSARCRRSPLLPPSSTRPMMSVTLVTLATISSIVAPAHSTSPAPASTLATEAVISARRQSRPRSDLRGAGIATTGSR